jgi:imidazolonepropionase-like amidohydrolase
MALARAATTPVVAAGRVERSTAERAAARTMQQAPIAAANLRRVFEAGIPIAMGTDAGNPLTFHGPSVYVEMEAMQAAGLTPMQVLVASTQGGARAMGRERDLGTLEAGKSADLLVVDADPTANIANLRRLRWVMRGGVARGMGELQRVVAGTAAPD